MGNGGANDDTISLRDELEEMIDSALSDSARLLRGTLIEGGLDNIQPIKDYVRDLLEETNEKYNLGINTENPTRKDRLLAALAVRDENYGQQSLEIMAGMGSGYMATAFTLHVNADRQRDPVLWYGALGHLYKSEDEEE